MKNSKLIFFLLLCFLLSLTTCQEIKKEMLVTTGTVSNILISTADVSGTVLDLGDGATQHGHCYATTANANVSGTKTELGAPPLGGFTSVLTGLSPGTKYYIKAYLSRGKDVVYGDEITFTTASDQLPEVTTVDITGVSKTGAVSGGNVTDEGGTPVTARGVCWSSATNPAVDGNKTTNGSGTGSFSSTITSLTAGTKYYVKAYATNSGGTAYGNELSFTTTPDAPTLPTIITAAVTSVTVSTAVCGGEVTNEGGATVTARGVCWSTSINPDINGNKTIDGDGQGSFNSNLAGLNGNTTYYVRAYAINSVGPAYGNELSFTTGAILPTITTSVVTAITSTSAVSGGEISSDGGSEVTARGICWSTSQDPSVDGSHTNNGSGTGNFISNITDLSPGVTYYVRAYAINSIGTKYGNELSFQTVSEGPVLTTAAVTSVTSTTATCGGNITSDGGSPVVGRGVCWSTNTTPIVDVNNKTNDGTGPGPFVSTITGLDPGTKYYVRAYATSSAGTSYGTAYDFTTDAVVPTLNTLPISSLTSTSASSGGDITNSGGASITSKGVCWKTSSGPTISDYTTNDGIGPEDFISSISGLTLGTKYYLRAYATNSVGAGYGNEVEFITYMPPAATTGTATSVTKTSADLNGNISSNGLLTTVTFEYGLTASYGNSAAAIQSPISGSGMIAVSASISGLTEGTLYHFRVKAESAGGMTFGEDVIFYTLKQPSASTYTPTSIKNTDATFGGAVNPYNYPTVVTFEYGTTISYGMSVTAIQSPVDGNTILNVNADVNGLVSGQVYHYRIKAANSGGTAYGGDQQFTTTIKDADGNSYNMETIGGQTWMKENLKTTKLNDGTTIDLITYDYEWRDAYTTNPRYCWFLNNESTYKNTYGALYNWHAVNSNKLCPQGWHVPSDDEWTNLVIFLGGTSVAGGKMKEAGLTHWLNINTGATNESGFTGLPGGCRIWDGSYSAMGFIGYWWSSTRLNDYDDSWLRYLENNSANITRMSYIWRGGFSVRCIRD